MQPTGLTREKLEELAKDESKTVLFPEYDHHEAWPLQRIFPVVMKCLQVAKNSETIDEVHNALIHDSEVREFSKYHPILFKNAVRPEFAKNDKYVKCLLFMIQQRVLSDSGKFTEASQNVQAMTLQTCAPKPND